MLPVVAKVAQSGTDAELEKAFVLSAATESKLLLLGAADTCPVHKNINRIK
jgi:hypothetical protein